MLKVPRQHFASVVFPYSEFSQHYLLVFYFAQSFKHKNGVVRLLHFPWEQMVMFFRYTSSHLDICISIRSVAPPSTIQKRIIA